MAPLVFLEKQMARKLKIEQVRVPFNEWDYPQESRKKRIVFRSEIKDQLKRAKTAKWYVRETANDGSTTLSYCFWIESHRECVVRALEWRKRLRATNLYY